MTDPLVVAIIVSGTVLACAVIVVFLAEFLGGDL